MTLAYMEGPIPPASSGLGSHAASPTSARPLATMQSFCLLTGTCQFPFVLPWSSGLVESLPFLMHGLSLTYLSIRAERLSFIPSLLFRLSRPDLETPRPMFTLFFPFGKTHA